jgi:hypothetical protein
MDHGRPDSGDSPATAIVFRPRPATAKVAAVACAAFLVVTFATGSRDMLWFAAIPFLIFLQCFQRIEIAGDHARRVGLRAVTLDLTTTWVQATGRSWWMELFFLGRSLELRDAERHGLLIESWLWSKATRDAVVGAALAANPIPGDGAGEAAHS